MNTRESLFALIKKQLEERSYNVCTPAELSFNMEITFDEGRGYVPSDVNKQNYLATAPANVGAPIGLIFIDSIFTPVYKVEYSVENTRVGNITDYDKLTMKVLTNGTITAKEAVSLAAKVLNEHLKLFIDMSNIAQDAETLIERPEVKRDRVLEMTIEELDLSVRSFNCLKRAGIDTVAYFKLYQINTCLILMLDYNLLLLSIF